MSGPGEEGSSWDMNGSRTEGEEAEIKEGIREEWERGTEGRERRRFQGKG